MGIKRLLLVLVIPLLAGCTRPINRAAERKIRDALPAYIGPAKQWLAHVDNPPERTVRGRLSRVTIDGEGVLLKNTITLARLHIVMNDADVDTGRARLRSVGLTTFQAEVTESALNNYLRQTASPEDSVRIRSVRLINNRLTLDAGYRLLGRDVGFSADVEPKLVSPSRLEFDPERFALLGIRVPLPDAVLNWLSRKLTDGFDFSTLPFPIHIDSVRIQRGTVSVSGTADVMRSLNERISQVLGNRSARARPD